MILVKIYSIGDFAKKLGVSQNTLRNWEKDGKLIPLRTPGNKRKYTEEMYFQFLGIKKKENTKETILYSRVSSSGQKSDLENQKEYLKKFSIANGYAFSELYVDIGSALNYKRKNFLKIIDKVLAGEVERIIITNKDRFVRFGYEFFETMFQKFGCEIIVIDKREDATPEQELAEDLVNIVQHFSAKIYGKRTYKSRKLNEKINETLKEDLEKEINSNQRENLDIT